MTGGLAGLAESYMRQLREPHERTEGLAALADLHKAHLQRQHARHLRAHASLYSTEYQWVQDAHKAAKAADKKAECY